MFRLSRGTIIIIIITIIIIIIIIIITIIIIVIITIIIIMYLINLGYNNFMSQFKTTEFMHTQYNPSKSKPTK